MFSCFSPLTGKFELDDEMADPPPTLHIPSNTAMIHCVIMSCRSETQKLNLALIEPFVTTQVIGIVKRAVSLSLRTAASSSFSMKKTGSVPRMITELTVRFSIRSSGCPSTLNSM